MDIFIIIGIVVLIALLLFLITKVNSSKTDEKSSGEIIQKMDLLKEDIKRIEQSLKEEMRLNRDDLNNSSRENRTELNNSLNNFQKNFIENLKAISDNQIEQLRLISENNSKSIAELNKTIEEKINNLIDKTTENNVEGRNELRNNLKSFNDFLLEKFSTLQNQLSESLKLFNENLVQKFGDIQREQNNLITSTEKRLEEMRLTVDEKLQKTLESRLGESFKLVSQQLENVQKGLGEMQTLASDVGGLKKVLSNVKMRGGIGEVQLSLLLEQILAPEQYQANVKTKENTTEVVEFAVKLPGKDSDNNVVWLPIDAKFPKDVYEQLQTAYDIGDITQIEQAQKNLELTIKKMAKDISDKYLNPPHTTDFAIMFLPFEGIYAEVVRKASLLEELIKTYKVVVTGPSTLAAILNSLQMGFRTLAIQKRSSEVWKILSSVKREFGNFGDLMKKAQNNIQTGLNQLDDVIGVRTRAIQRQLRDVETMETDKDTNLLENNTNIIEKENTDNALF